MYRKIVELLWFDKLLVEMDLVWFWRTLWFFFSWASCSNHCLAALDLGAGVEQPFDYHIVQSRQAMQSMRRSMDWTTWSTVCSSRPHSQTAEEAIPHLYKHERKHPTPLQRRSDPGSSWDGRSVRVGAGVGDENVKSCWVDRPLRIPLVIRPMRRTYVVVVRGTDELLCGEYKWVSRFETPCICTRWTGERWVEQVFQAPWHDVLKTVWLQCDEAQQVGCLREWEDCPLV